MHTLPPRPRGPARRSRRGLCCSLALAGLALSLGACSPQAPKGQVVATVNGQEITALDLAAEARARGGAAPTGPVLLQNVVGRLLLAQAAHRNGLDSYPGYPSDMARLKEDFLARRMLQSVFKPTPAPTPAQVAQTIAAHPFQFDRRMRLDMSQLQFSGEDGLRAVQGLDSLGAMAGRLKNLGVAYQQHDRTVDTAQLPEDLAARLVAEPVGAVFVLREGDAVNEIVIRNRQSVDLPPAQQQALATELTRRQAGERQVQTEVDRLERQAKIAYQPGYAPPKPSAKTGG